MGKMMQAVMFLVGVAAVALAFGGIVYPVFEQVARVLNR